MDSRLEWCMYACCLQVDGFVLAEDCARWLHVGVFQGKVFPEFMYANFR